MPTSKYTPVIGLEIHAELKTASKMFCSCKNDPDEERPNANICPVCMGHPGTLPTLNKEAIRSVLKIGTAVGGDLADFTEWDRKNYFYPDIPKGYQISQFKYPLVSNGAIAGVALERIHLEEDTASSTHDQHEKSLVDFNRAGVPLMELVTKPVIYDAATAVAFASELQLLLRYLGAGDANMEKGEMRVEANISVSPTATFKAMDFSTFGVKTEVKNLNSFRAVERAIAFEIERQIAAIEAGEKVVQETRGWDDAKNATYSQRAKESSHDYRYFPDPDIPKMKISEIPEFAHAALAAGMPELPWAKRERFARDFGTTPKEVAMMVESPALAGYFESIIAPYAGDAKRVKLTINYLLSDYLGLLKAAKQAFSAEAAISPASFAELVTMTAAGDLSSRGAKDLLPLLMKDRAASAKSLAESNGLIQKSDTASLEPAIEKVIAENEKAVAEYRAGKIASLQFLIGMAMKATKGAGSPAVIKDLLVKKLG